MQLRCYFKAPGMIIGSSECSINNYGKIVAGLFKAAKKFEHIPKTVSNLPDWAKEILSAKERP